MLNATRKLTNILVTLLFSVLVIVVFVQVICRILSISFPYADEMARYTFVWLIYLGGTITIRNGMNICFDVVLEALPKKAWKVAFTIENLISCAFLAMAVVLGTNLCITNLGQKSSVIKLNMGIVMMAIPIGCLLMFFEQVSFYLRKMKEAKVPAVEGGDK